jgi:hypothetical protein
MNILGKIIKVLPLVEGSGKKGTWQKQEFILETPGQYPKQVCLSLWGQEKIDKYDLQVGLTVTAHIELESREYNGRYYTEVRAWKIEWDANQRRWTPGGEEPKKEQRPETVKQEVVDNGVDDLPF